VAHDGSKGPKPYRQTRASTLFLRVPVGEWPSVKRGMKPEFRAPSGPQSQLNLVTPPLPVIAYSVNRRGQHDAALMVLEAMWCEPLGAISEESLREEGCATLAEFRRKWMLRERKRFTPTRIITVYRVRPWRFGLDEREMAQRLLVRLYGDWLEAEEEWAA
jgi:hypothetical protein